MRVELARDVEHLLTRGNRYHAKPEPGGGIRITGTFTMVVPEEFVHRITVSALDGTPLIEGDTYDLRVDRRRGGPQTMRGWEVLGTEESGSSLTWVRMIRRGSRWGGAIRRIELASIVSAEKVAARG